MNRALELKGLIPAAGKGVRAGIYSKEVHKGMLEIDGTPNMEHLITSMRDHLGIREITIVIGHLGHTIKAHFGDGSRLGVILSYVENTHLDRGLAWSVFLGARTIDTPFCMMLCDECYTHANHQEMHACGWQHRLGVCAGLRVDDTALIQRNYSIILGDDRIARLHEKPSHIDSDIMGCGTFLFQPAIFSHLERAFAENDYQYVEFVSFLDGLCQAGQNIGFFELTGIYANINDRDSLHLAKYHRRSLAFEHNRIALLVYAEGHEHNIAFTVERYSELSSCCDLFLALPHGIDVPVLPHHVSVVPITAPGQLTDFGERLLNAMDQIDADIIILADADYSFPSRDVAKLLAYLPEADMVIGTRTTRQLIEQGSTMKGVVRAAHIFLGKLAEVLWWKKEVRFTDAGCIFRAIWRPVYDKIRPNLWSRGPELSAEMMIELLNQNLRVIEIPVNFFNRSEALNQAYQHPATFFKFLFTILKKRFRIEKNK